MSRIRERGNWLRENTHKLGIFHVDGASDVTHYFSSPFRERCVDEVHYRGHKNSEGRKPLKKAIAPFTSNPRGSVLSSDKARHFAKVRGKSALRRKARGSAGKLKLPNQGASGLSKAERRRNRRRFYHRHQPYIDGGPMELQRAYFKWYPSAVYDVKGFGSRRYVGQFIPAGVAPNPTGGLPPAFAVLPTQASRLALGAKAIERYRPGRSPGDLGQFLRELERIPVIPFDFLNLARRASGVRKDLLTLRNAGNEYLNVVYGWEPLLQSIRNIWKVAEELDATLAQLRRDNGRPVRRRGSVGAVKRQVTVFSSSTDFPRPSLTIEMYASPTQNFRTNYQLEEERQWFSGRFQYWIPDIDSPGWPARAKRKLFGFDPTPALLWEILPWSWLIDWFTNVGTILSNMSENAAENLVIDYAYLMQQRKLTATRDHQVRLNDGQLVRCKSEQVREYKLRTRATPYGFDVAPASLSEKQMLILGSLGISRFF